MKPSPMTNDVCSDPACSCSDWYALLVGEPAEPARCEIHGEGEPVIKLYPPPVTP